MGERIPYKELQEGDIRLVKLYAGEFDSPIEVSNFNVAYRPTLQQEGVINIEDEDEDEQNSTTQLTSQLTVPSIDIFLSEEKPRVGEKRPFKHIDDGISSPISLDRTTSYQGSDYGGEGFRNPRYEALSYIWGRNAHVEINFRTDDGIIAIRIPPNLEVALRHLRHPKTNRTFYVDMLSISQYDDAEKARQIGLFSDIFHGASNVCIWLGSSTDDSDLAMDFIQQLLDFNHLDGLPLNSSYRQHWLALSKLIARDWFRRRWIVQEMAVARKATVHCGTKSCSWDDFADALALFQSRWASILQLIYPERPLEIGEVQPPGAASLVRVSANIFRKSFNGDIQERRYDLETLLALLPTFDIAHPLDAIYSVMGLAKDTKAMQYIPKGYGLDPAVVFAKVVAYIIHVSKSLDILCRPWSPDPSGGRWKTWKDYDIWEVNPPTWIATVKDLPFSRRSDGQYDRNNGDSFVGLPGRRIYNASAETIAGNNTVANPTNEFIALTARGFKIDTIKLDGGNSNNATIPEKWQQIAGWSNRAADPVPDHFWRTLVADRTIEGDNPPNWYGKACQYALRLVNTRHVGVTQLFNMCKNSSHLQEFLHRVQTVIWNRKMFLTETSGVLGLGPSSVEVGDWICILYGCSVPVVLRPHTKGHFTLVGECFVYDLMEGQAIERRKRRRHQGEPERDFVIH